MKKTLIIVIPLLVIIAVAAFYLGYSHGKNKEKSDDFKVFKVRFYETYKDYCNCLDCDCPSGPKLLYTYYVREGGKTDKPNPPVQEGRIFIGWVLDDETNQELFNFDTPITKDINLYSKWD